MLHFIAYRLEGESFEKIRRPPDLTAVTRCKHVERQVAVRAREDQSPRGAVKFECVYHFTVRAAVEKSPSVGVRRTEIELRDAARHDPESTEVRAGMKDGRVDGIEVRTGDCGPSGKLAEKLLPVPRRDEVRSEKLRPGKFRLDRVKESVELDLPGVGMRMDK